MYTSKMIKVSKSQSLHTDQGSSDPGENAGWGDGNKKSQSLHTDQGSSDRFDRGDSREEHIMSQSLHTDRAVPTLSMFPPDGHWK